MQKYYNLLSRFDYSLICLLLVLLSYCMLWLISPQLFKVGDPWGYSEIAAHVARSEGFGDHNHLEVIEHRIGIILPTALFFKLFGVSILTTNITPLLSSLLIIVIVWLSLPDKRSRCIGAILSLTSIALLRSATELLPDVTATAFMALSFYFLLLRKKVVHEQGGRLSVLIPIAAMTALFIGFIAKLTAYWAIPLWFWAFAVDFNSEDKTVLLRRFYFPAILLGLILGIGYLVACEMVWDDPLARFKALQAAAPTHYWRWDDPSLWEIIKRMTVGPVIVCIGFLGVTIAPLAMLSIVVTPRPVFYWAYYGLVCLFFFWFGTTSFSEYQPLPLEGRMVTPMLPASLILAAYLISQLSVYSKRPSWINSCLPVFLILTISGLQLAIYLRDWKAEEKFSEIKAINAVRERVNESPSKNFILLCSDEWSPDALEFYFGYRYPENLKAVYLGDFEPGAHEADYAFNFIHRFRSNQMFSWFGIPHYDSEIDRLSLPVLFENEEISLTGFDYKQHLDDLEGWFPFKPRVIQK